MDNHKKDVFLHYFKYFENEEVMCLLKKLGYKSIKKLFCYRLTAAYYA